MVFAAGQKLLALDLNNGISNSKLAYSTGSFITLTTSPADVPGATLSVTCPLANTIVIVEGIFDMDSNGAVDTGLGLLSVDGVVQTNQATFLGNARDTVSQTWRLSLSAGAHTVKLQAQKSGSTNTVHCYATHTSITATGNGIT